MADDRHPNLDDALDGTEPDVAELEAVARLLAELPRLEAPPAALFDRIAAEAFAEPAAAPAAAPETAVADVVPLPRRRWPMLAAVAAVVVLAAGFGASLLLGGDSDSTDREQVVALDALPGFEGVEAVATVVEADGERRVELALAEVELPPDSHLELWLLDPDVSQTISLGVLDDSGTFTVPAGVDLAATPILDVSVELDDGDPTHSGVSVVRGEIDPT